MATVIKGLGLLEGWDKTTIVKMEKAALEVSQKAKVDFTILKVTDNTIVIRATQDKNAEEYFDTKKLVQLTHDTFLDYSKGLRIIVHPIPFQISPVEIVDTGWIDKNMLQLGIALKQLTIDTGLNKTYLSSIINGTKPLSQAMRSMFYWYFKYQEQATQGNAGLTKQHTKPKKASV